MQSKCHLWRADDDGDGGVQRNGRGYMSRMHAHVQLECIKPRISSFARISLKSKQKKVGNTWSKGDRIGLRSTGQSVNRFIESGYSIEVLKPIAQNAPYYEWSAARQTFFTNLILTLTRVLNTEINGRWPASDTSTSLQSGSSRYKMFVPQEVPCGSQDPFVTYLATAASRVSRFGYPAYVCRCHPTNRPTGHSLA